MYRIVAIFLCALLLGLQGCFYLNELLGARQVAPDPAKALLVTSDIDNFWAAYDVARKHYQKGDTQSVIKAFEDGYFAKGSAGLNDYAFLKIKKENYWRSVMNAQTIYDTIRPQTLALKSLDAELRKPFYELKKIYPDAIFPNVYFVIGMFTSGGTATKTGLHIGTEMNSLPENIDKSKLFRSLWLRQVAQSSSKLPLIVAHELIHFQQPPNGVSPTLLEKSLREGSADFVGELISGGTINDWLRPYAEAREKTLWKEFAAEMNGADQSKWLGNGGNSSDRPADLGYWIGLRICKMYYEKAADKQQAIKDILTMTDAKAFLKASGYAEEMAKMP